MQPISFRAAMQITTGKKCEYINPSQVVRVSEDFKSNGSIVETSDGKKSKYDIPASKMVRALWEAEQNIDVHSLNVFKSWENTSQK